MDLGSNLPSASIYIIVASVPYHTGIVFMLCLCGWRDCIGMLNSGGRGASEWVANPLCPGHTSALQIKTRSAKSFNVYL